MLAEGVCPQPPSLSHLSSRQARSGPGGAQGCVCHGSLATWLEAPGKGVQSGSGRGEGPARSLPWTRVLLRHPPACLLLQGWGEARNSAPLRIPAPLPPALSSQAPEMPLLPRLSGALSQFSI